MTRGRSSCQWLGQTLLILTPVLCFPFGGYADLGAQEVGSTLTLDDAINLARRNNPTFLSTENDQGPADWNVKEAYGLFLPDFSTSVSGQYSAPGSPSFGIFDAGDLGLGVTDYFFSGYNLTASYSLLGGNLFRLSSARADRRATEARITAASFTLESEVTAQYLMALRARDGVEVALRQLDRAQQNFELADARVAVGAATPTDGKQAEVEKGRAQIDLLEAESLMRTEKLRLLEQLGVQAEGEFSLMSEFELFQPTWDRDDLVSRAMDQHPQLRAFQAQESARKASSRQAWSAYLPNVFMSASWSGRARQIGDEQFLLNSARGAVSSQASNCQFWNEVSAGLTQPLTGYPQECGASVLTPDQEAQILANNDVFPFDFRKEPWSLYVQVSFPVFQGFGRQRQVAEAKAAAEDARFDRIAEELRLQTGVTQAFDELMTATQVVEIETRNREVAEEQLELAQERYRLGASSFLELLEAQSSMATAERDFLNARYRFHGAIWALEAAVGERLRPEADFRP
ncbi:MAG: TolC family protein [Gemmatimonadetes bacterium]|nr:TolC family protein [Gemmatimonadota bacterium]